MIALYHQHNSRFRSLTRTCLVVMAVGLTLLPANAAGEKNEMSKRIFTPCPDTPNCVSSLEIGSKHYIEPLRYQGNIKNAKKKLIDVINSLKRTRVLEDKGNYIRTTFTSLLFRFIDDVEFQFDDDAKLIHMKSASRIGYSDLGANRRRCEAIREKFNH